MNKRYVLKNKKRFYTFIIILTIAISSLLFTPSIWGKSTDIKYEQITVEKGDTLWGIAKRYYKKGDIRSHIDAIEKLNNITDSTIYEGDVILLPA